MSRASGQQFAARLRKSKQASIWLAHAASFFIDRPFRLSLTKINLWFLLTTVTLNNISNRLSLAKMVLYTIGDNIECKSDCFRP